MGRLIDLDRAIDTEYIVKDINGVEYVMLSEVQMKLRKLPPAQPERKNGKWIRNGPLIQCSECKCSSWTLEYEDLVKSFNFCPNCGADMRGDKND